MDLYFFVLAHVLFGINVSLLIFECVVSLQTYNKLIHPIIHSSKNYLLYVALWVLVDFRKTQARSALVGRDRE